MASPQTLNKKSLSFFCYVLLLLLDFAPHVFSRSLHSTDPAHQKDGCHLQLLDVSASLNQALNVFSLDSETKTTAKRRVEPVTTSSNSTLIISLHPRSFMLNAHRIHKKNYTLLTLSRLDRDLARVNSLISKQELILSNFKHNDLKPVDAAIQQEELQSPVTSGASQGSGEYFTRLGIGQPAKELYMVLDTGSDISWLQCEPCSDCYQQSDPVFNPAGSSTYRPLTCESEQCSSLEVSACRSNSCQYQVSYGDGSYTVGDFVTETVSFAGSGSVPNVALGCGHDNEGLFIGSAGLLGLGGGSLSLPSQIKASSFSYCLVNRDSSSSSTLEFNAARPGDSVLAPLLKNSRISTYFYVGLEGMSVGGYNLEIPASTFQISGDGRGGVIVDSGTAVTRLREEAYNSLRDSFAKLTQNLPSTTGFALFDTCYDLSSMTQASVPTVSFHFSGGKVLRLHPENYLIPVDGAGKFCLAFAPTSGSLSIIGNVQQQGTRVSYDLANKVVGFSPNKC